MSAAPASSGIHPILFTNENNPNNTPEDVYASGSVAGGIFTRPSRNSIEAAQFSGSFSGNVTTATRLQTARTINGTSFNGTANITVPVNVTARNTSAVTHYLLFVTTTGNTTAYRDSGLTYVPTSGVLTAIDMAATSDIRLKNVVSTGMYDALSVVNKMHMISYNWKDGKRPEQLNIGFSAQEIQQLVPEVVFEDSDGTLRLSYGKLVPVLVEAIKTLTNKVNELEDKING